MIDNRHMLAELTRMKVLFQARALATALGTPQPSELPASLRAHAALMTGGGK